MTTENPTFTCVAHIPGGVDSLTAADLDALAGRKARGKTQTPEMRAARALKALDRARRAARTLAKAEAEFEAARLRMTSNERGAFAASHGFVAMRDMIDSVNC